MHMIICSLEVCRKNTITCWWYLQREELVAVVSSFHSMGLKQNVDKLYRGPWAAQDHAS